ncbi:MAG: GNAT family N-acetyltransferase [Treponema sp.]|jgi:ribosomal protein S18 acetylase RimI-like enzyme|nr:GNAT family N-acetyltransferase [Treponema sp.]
MCFELSDALIDEMLFFMEDQNGAFYVDAKEGIVIEEADIPNSAAYKGEDGKRFFPLPEWDSSDGYRLMERFTARFKNPLIYSELTAALDQGKGVFRAFKNTINQHPEAEKVWFSFKEKEIKKEIIRWYNALREEWGLERIGLEPEETEYLVLEDFRIRLAEQKDLPYAEKLHHCCIEECIAGKGKTAAKALRSLSAETWRFPGDISFIAETGSGEFAAYISAILRNRILHIIALEVKSEYRGLGIGEALLSNLLEKSNTKNAEEVVIDLPADLEGFSRVLYRKAFKPFVTRYHLNLS